MDVSILLLLCDDDTHKHTIATIARETESVFWAIADETCTIQNYRVRLKQNNKKNESHHLGLESIAAHWPTKDIPNRDIDLWSNRSNCSFVHTVSHTVRLPRQRFSFYWSSWLACIENWFRFNCLPHHGRSIFDFENDGRLLAMIDIVSCAYACACARGHHVHFVWCLRAFRIIKFLSQQSYKSSPIVAVHCNQFNFNRTNFSPVEICISLHFIQNAEDGTTAFCVPSIFIFCSFLFQIAFHSIRFSHAL